MKKNNIFCLFLLTFTTLNCTENQRSSNESLIFSKKTKMFYSFDEYAKKDSSKMQVFTIKVNDNVVYISEGIIGKSLKTRKNEFTSKETRETFVISFEKDLLDKGFTKVNHDDKDLLFVQIQCHEEPFLLEEIEKELNIQLESLCLGSSITTGLDYEGNGSITFETWDIALGTQTIKKILKKHKLLEKIGTVIAKRISQSENDSDYEVVYPQNYTEPFFPN